MNDEPKQTEPGPNKKKPLWVRLLRTSVGLAILAVLFYLIPIEGVFDALRRAEPLPVFGASVISFLIYWATADRLRRLCDAHGHGWSTWEIFQINLATRFYGFLPGGNVTGIVIRFYKLTGDKRRYMATAVALFYDRIAATVTLCGVGAVFWLLERPSGSWQALAAILASMLVMILALIVLFDRSPGPVVSFIRRTASRFIGVKLHTVRQAVRESRTLSRGQTFTVFSLSIGAHLLGVLGWYLLCLSLGLDISLVTVGWVRTAIILATMIPVTVSGLGLREGAAVLLLTNYGVSQESALAFSLLVFLVTAVLIGLAGGLIEAFRLIRHPG